MDRKNVEALATLLNQPVKDIETALEAEGGLADRISAFRKDHSILSTDDKDKLINNAKSEARRTALKEVQPDDLSPETINKFVAWKLEKVEDWIKEEYGYEGDYKGIQDLVGKVVKQKSAAKHDDKDPDQIEELKSQITKIKEERDEAVKKAEDKLNSYIAQRELESAVGSIPLDVDDEARDKQAKLLRDSFSQNFRVVHEDGSVKVFPTDKDDFLKDEKLDPVPVGSVLESFAKDYGFKLKSPESGGQGGSSSTGKTSRFAGMSMDDFTGYLKDKGVNKMSSEGVKLYKEFREANDE